MFFYQLQKKSSGSTFSVGVPNHCPERGFYFLDPPGGLGTGGNEISVRIIAKAMKPIAAQ